MAGDMNNIFKTTAPYLETKKGDKILFPFSPPIFQSQVSQGFLNDLLDEGKKLNVEKDDWREKLAGNMKHGGSFIYKEDFILKAEPYLLTFVERFLDRISEQGYERQIGSLLDIQVDRRERRQGRIRLDTMWINYQHKFDFNPPHTHRGDLSFVIFCKVPKRIFTEQAVTNTKDAGKIMFQYGEHSHPMANPLYAIEPYDTLFLIFPANMKHLVPAFWTDDIRISAAGNFVVV